MQWDSHASLNIQYIFGRGRDFFSCVAVLIIILVHYINLFPIFWQLLGQNTTNNSTQIFCDVFQEGNVINSASFYVCDPDTTLTEEARDLSVYFGIFAAGVFVTWFLAHSLWSISAYRQSKRVRIAFYRAILRHDIGWFDTNDTSILGPLFVK